MEREAGGRLMPPEVSKGAKKNPAGEKQEGKRRRTFAMLMILVLMTIGCAVWAGMEIPRNVPPIEISPGEIRMENDWLLVEEDGTTTPVVLPLQLKLKPNQTVTLQRVLEEDFPQDASIHIISSFQDTMVCLDGVQVFRYFRSDKKPQHKISAPGSVSIRLCGNYSGKLLSVTWQAPLNLNKASISHILAGTGAQILFWQIKTYLPKLLCDFLIFFIGGCFLYYAHCVKSNKDLCRASIALGLFAMICATYLRFGTITVPLIYTNSMFRYVIAYCSMAAMPLPLLLYYRERAQGRMIWCYNALFYGVFANVALSLCLYMFLGVEFKKHLILTHISLGLTILLLLVHHIYNFTRGSMKGQRTENVGLIVMLVLSGLDLLIYFVRSYVYIGVFVRIGIVVYLASQLLSIADIHRQREVQRREMESQLLETRMELMMSQIKPHFLYNTLASISYLCEENPPVAKKTVDEFSDFLHGLLDTIVIGEVQKPIYFSRELSNLRHYLNVEQVRFGEMLRVEYDIQVSDFMLPPLTLQPVVENAVRHGVTKKPGGGTVVIVTRRDRDGVVLTVSDDGVGFDPNCVSIDERQHIGIKNVSKRLAGMCGGSLAIQSQPGCGTVVTLHIPARLAPMEEGEMVK